MKTTKEIYAQVFQCQRVNGSYLGNPNWLLTVREFDDAGNYTIEARKTSSNISDSYGEIPNNIYSKMPEPVEVAYTLTKSRLIKSIRTLEV